jgi:hypothetical protein
MAGPSKRPERKKKHDPMLHPAASRESIECDIALAAFDRASREMDKAWGVDRLVELVSPDIAKRWGQAMADLNEAIISNDPPMVQGKGGHLLARHEGHERSGRGCWDAKG